MTQLIIGIAINTLLFGLMSFIDPKMGVSDIVPKVLKNKYIDLVLLVLYFSSFFINSKLVIIAIIIIILAVVAGFFYVGSGNRDQQKQSQSVVPLATPVVRTDTTANIQSDLDKVPDDSQIDKTMELFDKTIQSF